MSENDDGIIYFYEHKDVKKLVPKYKNPHFNQTQMNIPARVRCIAPSGTGKTQWLLNYIHKNQDTFGFGFCTQSTKFTLSLKVEMSFHRFVFPI